jgi:rare lipoprotein A
MRPYSSRARAILGAGALGTTMLVAGATAGAQQQAPAPEPAPATTAVAKSKTTIKVLHRRLNVASGTKARVRGRVEPRRAGRTVRLQRRAGGTWKTIAATRTTATGRYRVAVRLRGASISRARIAVAGDRSARAAKRRVGRLTVFRPALASWYGPGLYGNRMACGGRLSTGTVGVAHKSLPCGKRVVLRKGSRFVHARVVDRGPYVGAREFDRTQATKNRLGFGSTGRVMVAH